MSKNYITFIHTSDKYIEKFSRPFPDTQPDRATFYYFTNSFYHCFGAINHQGFDYKPDFFYLFVKNPKQDNIAFRVLRCPDFDSTFRYFRQFEGDMHWLFKKDKKGHSVDDPPILRSYSEMLPDLVAKYDPDDNSYRIVKPESHKGMEIPLFDKEGIVPREFIDIEEIVSAVPKIEDAYPFITPTIKDGKYVWDDWRIAKPFRQNTFSVLGEEFSVKHYPVLYKWAQSNPGTLEERLGELADKLYDGNIGSAAQALESDLEHGG